jgi:3,4-dihydroxy 2-butanone 4-phosphate synthase/GTP cyclohydrolase II
MAQKIEYRETLLTVSEAAAAVRRGQLLLLVDHEMAWLCLPAQFARADALVSFLEIIEPVELAIPTLPVLVASGERLEALHVVAEMAGQSDPVAGGIDRVALEEACQILALPNTNATLREQLAGLRDQAGVEFVRAHPAGLLKRRGPAEAALDLLRIAGLEPVALVGRVVLKTDAFLHASLQSIGAVSYDDLAHYRKERRTSLVTQINLPTPLATFRLWHFQEIETGLPYLALTLGEVSAREMMGGEQEALPLLRLHSACATGDLFGSQRCDCQAQMHSSLARIAQAGRGVFLYLPQEGRGIGLAAKLQAYTLQDAGYDTLEANEQLGYPADAREYGCAIEILRELGVTEARLLTNNPQKLEALQQQGIVVEREPLEMMPTESNLHYLQTKLVRMGHLLSAYL